MARYAYVGDDTRVYPELGLTVAPGDTVELDKDPGDGRWKKAAAKASPAAPDNETADTDDAKGA